MKPSELTDMQLFAWAIKKEAGGESPLGQLAVAHVVLNRVERHTWYGYSVRDVLLKPWQFSCFNGEAEVFVVDGGDPCHTVAYLAMGGFTVDPTKGATHYHNPCVMPGWSGKLKFLMGIGNHLFYREE